jgi:hypothetical protein
MNASSTLDGRALCQVGAVTFNGTGGNLPTPVAPRFINVSRATNFTTVVIDATPNFLVTLQSSPTLWHTNWTTLSANTLTTNIWTVTDNTATATVTQRFYRAFSTP